MKRICLISVLACALLLSACATPTSSEMGTWQEQYDLGMRFLAEGQYSEAILAFSAAIDIDPKQAAAYIGRADAYYERAQGKEAFDVDDYNCSMRDYERARELDVDADITEKLVSVYIELAEYSYENDLPEEAAALYKKAASLTNNQGYQNRYEEILDESLRNQEQETEENQIENALFNSEGNEENIWHFVEKVPDNSEFFYIGVFSFDEGTVSFYAGYVASEILYDAEGTYLINKPDEILLSLTDKENGTKTDVIYTLKELDDGKLQLTQKSEQGLFFYHERGHNLVLEKGREVDWTQLQELQAAQQADELELSQARQHSLNVFMSNFSEQWFGVYDRNTTDMDQIAGFTHMYLYINKYRTIEYRTVNNIAYETFTLDDLNNVTLRFMGMSFTNQDASRFQGDAHSFYKDGIFFYEAADGASFPDFTVVREIEHVTDNIYKLVYDIYALDIEQYWEEGINSRYYYMNAREAEMTPEISFVAQGEATIEVNVSDGTESYHLVNYSSGNRNW